MKYYVIATKWSDEHNAQIKYIAGEFSTFINAQIFQQAYNDWYHADARVVSDYDIINR